MWTSLSNFPITTLVKALSSFIKRTAKTSTCNIGRYQRPVPAISNSGLQLILEAAVTIALPGVLLYNYGRVPYDFSSSLFIELQIIAHRHKPLLSCCWWVTASMDDWLWLCGLQWIWNIRNSNKVSIPLQPDVHLGRKQRGTEKLYSIHILRHANRPTIRNSDQLICNWLPNDPQITYKANNCLSTEEWFW